jgi:DNA repair protein RecO (recombination protein O)
MSEPRIEGRVYPVEAVVMRRLSIGETDRVVTLFTRDRGKIRAIAKGARGPKSRLAGLTEPFTHARLLLAQGQNLEVLTQGEVRSAFAEIRKDLERIGYASYFVELLDTGLEERQPVAELWDLLVAALGVLETATTPDVLARAFELHTMTLFGYEPSLHACVLDGAPLTLPGSAFHPLRGGMVCNRCARSTPGAVAVSSATFDALCALAVEPLVRAARSTLDPEVRAELSRCLLPYVRHHTDAPLRSLQFLDDVSAPQPYV